MSLWAYVNGMCTVACPGRTQDEIDSSMQQVVSELPAVFWVGRKRCLACCKHK